MRSHQPLTDPELSFEDTRFVRSQPRIYLHHLACYIGADPGERRELVHAAKYPSPDGRSSRASSHPFGDMLSMGWDEDVLSSLALQCWWCLARPATSEVDARRVEARLAIKLFERLVERINQELETMGSRVRLTDWIPMSMSVRGVKVVDSALLITEQPRRGRPIDVGALSFSTTRAHAHSDESMKHAAVLLWSLARAESRYLWRRVQLSRRLCIAADVFSSRLCDAKLGHTRRLRQAVAACEEIAAIWPEL